MDTFTEKSSYIRTEAMTQLVTSCVHVVCMFQSDSGDFETLPWFTAVETFCHGHGYEELEHTDRETLSNVIEKTVVPKITGNSRPLSRTHLFMLSDLTSFTHLYFSTSHAMNHVSVSVRAIYCVRAMPQHALLELLSRCHRRVKGQTPQFFFFFFGCA